MVDATAAPVLPVTASSEHPQGFSAELAIDGQPNTRWASTTAPGDQWLKIDLGKTVAIHNLRIAWEAAYAVDYEVQVSDDGNAWRSIATRTGSGGGVEDLDQLDGSGRWLRILCHKPSSFQLYSIWEIASSDSEFMAALAEVRARIQAIALEATRSARERLREALKDSGVETIVFATRPLYTDGHWYANIAYYAQDAVLKTYAKGGGLYLFHTADGSTTPLIEDAEGTIRDPAVHYDGRRIVFSWRKGGTETFHLYTIESDGSALTQLTSGIYDDIEPAWLPDGGIVFVSSRCRRWVNCWLTQVAVVHRCNADGSNIVPLSANIEQDNTPWPMPDGRILYTRWEYVDRSQVDYHHLWTMGPDGTSQNVFFGNFHPGGVFIDAKPVPGGTDVVFVNSPGHGAQEHAGRLALVNTERGPDDLGSIRNFTGEGYRDPYPISDTVFLAAHNKSLSLVGLDGVEEPLLTLPDAQPLLVHEPRPVIAHAPERSIPSRVDYTKQTGRLLLTDVYAGRNMKGVARGDIKKLLVLESLPKPINYTGGMDPLTYGGSFTLERVLGTVPVEDDGSAYMEVPAGIALFFVALDANGDSVKRMQSFCSVMPGETTSCLGCHEARTASGGLQPGLRPKAAEHRPSPIEPVRDVPDVLDFPRDIQPILDRLCVACHDYDAHDGNGPRAGAVILTGDHGPMFSHSYAGLTVLHQFVDGRDQAISSLPPRSIGSGASPLMAKLRGGHYGVQATEREIRTVQLWIDTGAPYPGTYAALGCGSIGGYYANGPQEVDGDWPASKTAAEVVQRRCSECHAGPRRLPQTLSDENTMSFWRPDWNDPHLLRSRHLVFNLSRPEKSLIVLAPLARNKGGLGLCKDGKTSKPVFRNTSDPDYKALLALCVAGKERLDVIKRFDMPGFRPPEPYLREMRRYGVLDGEAAWDGTPDVYALDRAYWQSFSQEQALKNPAYAEAARRP